MTGLSGKVRNIEEKRDFMSQVTGQLEYVVSNYDVFCAIAQRLERQDIRTWYGDYGDKNPWSIHLNEIEFPQDYIVIRNITDAYVQAVLSDTMFYRKWHYTMHNILWKDWDRAFHNILWKDLDSAFWTLSQEDKKAYLAKCRAMYEGIAVVETAQLSVRDWDYLVSEMEFFAGERSSAIFSKTFPDLSCFNNAKVLKVSGCEGCFDVYMAMSRNRLLLATCGCWQ